MNIESALVKNMKNILNSIGDLGFYKVERPRKIVDGVFENIVLYEKQIILGTGFNLIAEEIDYSDELKFYLHHENLHAQNTIDTKFDNINWLEINLIEDLCRDATARVKNWMKKNGENKGF